jgi:hypothetical protein
MTLRRFAVATAAVALLAFTAFCIAWRVDGGRWERVETPSMGEVAPVGSLLWVKAADPDALHVGDFISFHPPGSSDGVTYSHLIHEMHEDGTFTTKGVIPGPDPWQLTPDDVVGTVRMNWWGVGWIVAAGPLLIIGFLVVAFLRSLARRRWRLPITLVGSSLVVSVAIVLYQPFINAQQLAFAPVAGGGANATYVGTGLLPIRLTAHHGASVVLSDGEVGTVHVSKVDRDGKLRVGLRPAIPFWWWVALVLACFLPALYSLVIGFPPLPPDADGRRRRSATMEG